MVVDRIDTSVLRYWGLKPRGKMRILEAEAVRITKEVEQQTTVRLLLHFPSMLLIQLAESWLKHSERVDVTIITAPTWREGEWEINQGVWRRFTVAEKLGAAQAVAVATALRVFRFKGETRPPTFLKRGVYRIQAQ